MEGMESFILALLGFIYFYTLRWDDVPKGKEWIIISGGIVIVAWGLYLLYFAIQTAIGQLTDMGIL